MAFYLSGMDEAGYGPTLGPLVVGLVTLKSEDTLTPESPWKLLAPTVARRRAKRALRIADSKLLHNAQTGNLAPLEHGVLSFVACERGGEPPATFRELVRHLMEGRDQYLEQYPWYRGQDLPLPHSVPRLELLGTTRRLARRLAATGLEIAEIRARPVEVDEFNRELTELESKGEVNERVMGRFLAWLWRQGRGSRCEVWADRLGGRQRYGPMLYPLFPGARFDILQQEEEQQIYRATHPDGRSLVIHFHKDCENRSFATALASMTAKYLRELHMVLFNRWWQERIPALHRTAGYPGDARRFLAEIEPKRLELGVERSILIRRR